ncbi:hypothetical protein BDR05DRAFT_170111 [Suillus weaverae]|nr:hypothetical protein BDR05DRAFT_170111 [Suillus weaverae]
MRSGLVAKKFVSIMHAASLKGAIISDGNLGHSYGDLKRSDEYGKHVCKSLVLQQSRQTLVARNTRPDRAGRYVSSNTAPGQNRMNGKLEMKALDNFEMLVHNIDNANSDHTPEQYERHPQNTNSSDNRNRAAKQPSCSTRLP